MTSFAMVMNSMLSGFARAVEALRVKREEEAAD
jgi:hypothetical protein